MTGARNWSFAHQSGVGLSSSARVLAVTVRSVAVACDHTTFLVCGLSERLSTDRFLFLKDPAERPSLLGRDNDPFSTLEVLTGDAQRGAVYVHGIHIVGGGTDVDTTSSGIRTPRGFGINYMSMSNTYGIIGLTRDRNNVCIATAPIMMGLANGLARLRGRVAAAVAEAIAQAGGDGTGGRRWHRR
jgi:hypothetical protein